MTPLLFIECFVMGLSGQLMHLFVKFRGLRKRAKAANTTITFPQFVKEDVINIAICITGLVMVFLGLDEIAKYKPEIMNVVKWFFGLIGFTGSSIVLAFFSSSEKLLLKVIDKKTNIADGKE